MAATLHTGTSASGGEEADYAGSLEFSIIIYYLRTTAIENTAMAFEKGVPVAPESSEIEVVGGDVAGETKQHGGPIIHMTPATRTMLGVFVFQVYL